MFDPFADLNAIQKILIEDDEILALMDLTNANNDQRVKQIIKRSQWDGIAGSEKRMCIYFIPDRSTRNEVIMESLIEIDVHVPAVQDFKAWQIQERVKKLLHRNQLNKKHIKFYGQLGELPTMQGFFCCGSRFRFYRTI